jgi:phthiocerol/phenolphthiocerol synthesis type-I polyketide synthase C
MIVVPQRCPLGVLGLAVRLPGAGDLDALWSLLEAGRCAVSDHAPPDRWRPERFISPDRDARGTAYTFAGGYLDQAYAFDAAAFGLSPREAAQMDPQQRILLEVAWEALEDAGLPPSSLARTRVGVFVGASSTDYASVPMLDLGCIEAHFMVGNSLSILANRISYAFDLTGPSLTVDTACSSSLVALTQAAVAIEREDIDLALVAGVNILSSPAPFIGFSRAGMLSPTGRCRPFSAAADGYVRAEGAVVLVLGRVRGTGPRPRAVLRAVGVNSDGRTPGIAMPSVVSQRALIADLYARAEIAPAALAFVEAHGTGTLAGDPVEAAAIGSALGAHRPEPLKIGSVKSNIGHLECASGLVGLAKTVLALEHRWLPPSLHAATLNSAIDFSHLNLFVASDGCQLAAEGPLLAGICNYGFGGTNAHAVIERAPEAPAADTPLPTPDLLVVSAHTREALLALAAAHAEPVRRLGAPAISREAAGTRDLLRHRLVIDLVGTTAADAILAGEAPEDIAWRMAEARVPRARLGFVFSGNGCQYATMGKAAWERSPAFRQSLETTAALLRAAGGACPLELLHSSDAEDQLMATSAAQPALYAIQLATVDALAAEGITPSVVLGHSVGEVAAAVVAGALDRDAGTRLILARSAVQEAVRGLGRMAVLGCVAETASRLIAAHDPNQRKTEGARVEIAAENSPSSTTISGPSAAVHAVMVGARSSNVAGVLLDIDYPFHHALLDLARAPLLQRLSGLPARAPRLSLLSTVTGAMQQAAMDGEYWWRNMRQPVLFRQAAAAALEMADLFVEIGPKPILLGALADIGRQVGRVPEVMGSLRPDAPAAEDPIRTILVEAVARGAVPRDWGVPTPAKRSLPAMRWHRHPFKLMPTPEQFGLYGGTFLGQPVHPLAGARIAPDGGEWRGIVSLETLPFLSGHVVNGTAVFPGTAFAEIIAAIGEQVLGTPRVRIDDLDLRRAMVLEPGVQRELSTLWNEADATVTIRSRRRHEAEGFVVHARGTVRVLGEAAPPPLPPPDGGETLDASVVYAAAAQTRLDYRGAFRAVTELRRFRDGFVADLTPQSSDIGAFSPIMVTDPATFDAAFHGLFLDVAPESCAAVGELPVRIGRLSLFAPRAAVTRAVGRLRARTRGTRTVDLDLLGPDGALVGRAEAVVMRRVVHAAWRETDRIVQLAHHDEADRLRAIQAAVLRLRRPPAGRGAEALAALDAWAAALGRACPSIPKQTILDPTQPDALALWHALREFAFPDAAGGGARHAAPASPEQALLALGRSMPEAVADIRLAAWATSAVAELVEEGRATVIPPALKETWLARSVVTAPTMAAVAAAILSASVEAFPAPRVALLEPGLAGLLPHLMPAIRAGRIVAEVLAENPAQIEPVLARLDARGLVGVRDANGDGAGPVNIMACVATVALDADGAPAVRQATALGAPLILGIVPHLPAIDAMLGVELGYWALSPTPEAPVGRWPLPAETLAAVTAAGLGEIIARELDETGAGLVVLAGTPALANGLNSDRNAPSPGAPAVFDMPVFDIREDALELARAKLPELELRPFLGPAPPPGEDGQTVGRPVLDIETASCASPLAALRQRLLRLRDLAQGFGGRAGGRIYVLLDGAAAENEAIRAALRTLINENPTLLACAVRARGAEGAAIGAAIARHALEGSVEPEITLEGARTEITRIRRGSPKFRAPQQGERTLLHRGSTLEDLGWRLALRQLPGPGEVEVAVVATGLNFRDLMLTLGLLDEEILGEGATTGSVGFEFSGTVTRAGPGEAENWPLGTAVMGFARDAFTSHLIVPAQQVVRAPAGLSLEAAAALPVAATTAWYALLDRARLQAGETVLIHGAAGAVGLAALAIARAHGARTIAAAGTPEKRALLRLLGADAVVDSRAADFEAQVRRASDGVDVVLNSVAGEAMRATLRLVRPFGRFVELGKRDFLDNTHLGVRAFSRNVTFLGVDLDQLLAHSPEVALKASKAAVGAFESGTLPPIPTLVLEGEAIGDAFRLMQASAHVGKIVVRPAACGATRLADDCIFQPARGVHVVLGGTRGFGLETALWLACRGARQVVVASRAGEVASDDLARIEALRQGGVAFEVVALDVTDTAAVAAAFAGWREAHGRIAGIVHAAMVLRDGLLASATEKAVEAVLAPKVAGIRAVMEASRADALQYLVAYSSSSTLVGTPGQGAYVAANGYLEGAVRELRERGVPALAVCWGAISDAGVVARNAGLADRLRANTGVVGVSAAEALDHLGRLLADPMAAPVSSGYAVLRASVSEHRLATVRSPLFAEVFRGSGADSKAMGQHLDLAGLNRDEAAERLLTAVREEVAQILRLPVDEVDADRAMIDLGLDSLMLLELKLGIEKRVGMNLAGLSGLGSAGSVRQLSSRLLGVLRPDEAREADAASALPAHSQPDAIAAWQRASAMLEAPR